MYNIASNEIGVLVNGGNDQYLERVVAGGSGGRSGIEIHSNDGLWLAQCDFGGIGIGMFIIPDPGKPSSGSTLQIARSTQTVVRGSYWRTTTLTPIYLE